MNKRLLTIILLLVPALGILEACAARSAPIAVTPSSTDPHISTTKFNEPHYCWLPQGKPRNRLLLFLPGTGGHPRADFKFAAVAADMGYHVIFLMYPDGAASQRNCANRKEKDAYLVFREAIIQGGHFHRFTVSRADSIENRLEKLLSYLDHAHPDEGWGAYLQGPGAIAWPRIAVAGHSQGGGHAYVIGKLHTVDRVIMFGSPKDYSNYYHAPAGGFDAKTRTPLSRMYSFTHLKDNGNGASHDQMMQTLAQIGLTRLGVARTDQTPAPFGNAHVLVTDVSIQGTRYHGAVLHAEYVGTTLEQAIVPVWRYMLDN